ncbi:hypothetical protein VN97_g10042 [Penicillium thymicola]|uniref:Uncharacterized protein n=1 Tax=Penicillium thymicola TaxID=293382 RepID=A0AAI9TA96_PENTH|nr:hypothetical protein VN97_g10042 [Penicillium thymicola]
MFSSQNSQCIRRTRNSTGKSQRRRSKQERILPTIPTSMSQHFQTPKLPKRNTQKTKTPLMQNKLMGRLFNAIDDRRHSLNSRIITPHILPLLHRSALLDTDHLTQRLCYAESDE